MKKGVAELDPVIERQYHVIAISAATQLLAGVKGGTALDTDTLSKVAKAMQAGLRDLALHHCDLKARANRLDPPMALNMSYSIEGENLVRKFRLTEVEAQPLAKQHSGPYCFQPTAVTRSRSVEFGSIYEVEDFLQQKENWQEAALEKIHLPLLAKRDAQPAAMAQALVDGIAGIAEAIRSNPVNFTAPSVIVNATPGPSEERVEYNDRGDISRIVKKPIP